MAGGDETKKAGTSSGGAREVVERPNAAGELLGRRDEAVDFYPSSFGSVVPPDAVMERQRSAGRRRIPSQFRPPAPRQSDVNKKQSSNREVEEGGGSGSHADGSTAETAPVTSAISNEDSSIRNPAPKAPARDPVYDDLYSGEIKQDVAFRGDWWRGGVYY